MGGGNDVWKKDCGSREPWPFSFLAGQGGGKILKTCWRLWQALQEISQCALAGLGWRWRLWELVGPRESWELASLDVVSTSLAFVPCVSTCKVRPEGGHGLVGCYGPDRESLWASSGPWAVLWRKPWSWEKTVNQAGREHLEVVPSNSQLWSFCWFKLTVGEVRSKSCFFHNLGS